MSGVTPGWKFVSIGFEGVPVLVQGTDLWKHNERWASTRESIVVPHPSYPSERHTMFVYTLSHNGKSITFATGEYSNGVWGFYVPT